MTVFGQLCLLLAFVASGYAAFACLLSGQRGGRAPWLGGTLSGVVGVGALTVASGLLAWALLVKDYHFAYVAKYSGQLLPWHYSLSAFWVGQAGSLLLWAWFLGLLAVAYRFWPGRRPSDLRQPAFGILMAYLCFLVAIMVFAADPMAPSVGGGQRGVGLSPLLEHPVMLIHPPVVFLGYALWSLPFALALASLLGGQPDAKWIREARPWALLAWIVLGSGILLGADWAYEELGWGGYWGWDPVENGSLIPWLAGTALIHASLAWQHAGALKKTTYCLAIGTFALCNFASFLTRSGIFSSLHAFSHSPIGWMFLVLMFLLISGGGAMVVLHRSRLAPAGSIRGIATRESVALIAIVALLLLTLVTAAGTISSALTSLVLGKRILVGPAFYNNVLIPTGLVLLATTAIAPLLRWRLLPTAAQRRTLLASAGAAGVAVAVAASLGCRNPIALAVAGAAVTALVAPLGSLALDVRGRKSEGTWYALFRTFRSQRRQYAGFLIHLGFVCVAIGVTGSSLGKQERDVSLREGETTTFAGQTVRLARVVNRELPDKLVMEAELEVSSDGGKPRRLVPARQFHLLQKEWTTEVAIDASWQGDFYTILNEHGDSGPVSLKLIYNPMMRWIWFGGFVAVAGALVGLWPARSRAKPGANVPAPKWAARTPRRQLARERR